MLWTANLYGTLCSFTIWGEVLQYTIHLLNYGRISRNLVCIISTITLILNSIPIKCLVIVPLDLWHDMKNIKIQEMSTFVYIMMGDPQNPMFGDEICPVCSKPKNGHDSKEMLDCSKQLVEMGMMRYCGLCGLTKPEHGLHDRCSKCGEKYSFTNS